MHGPIHCLLAADHRRLEALLDRATAGPDVDAQPYAEFRRGLLRHIGMEEKILLPAAQRARGGEPLAAAAKLRLDHGAIAALLVPSPTPAIVGALRAILRDHDAIEEDPGGVYDVCDELLADETDSVLGRLEAAPAVPVHDHVDSELVRAATRRALERAGYDFEL
jgi:hemerythrin HHE cation binding domain-containing protein